MAQIPNPDYNYPKCYAALTSEEKKTLSEKIFQEFDVTYLPQHLEDVCQDDFKLCSLVGYKLAVKHFDMEEGELPFQRVDNRFLPVRYCGGDMCYGRVFSINHCSFSSPDSIIGFRNSEVDRPQEYFKILKGLKFFTTFKNWVLFKLDSSTTDDYTGMLYSPLEKNFTIEFAHFPHDGGLKTIFRWIDC